LLYRKGFEERKKSSVDQFALSENLI